MEITIQTLTFGYRKPLYVGSVRFLIFEERMACVRRLHYRSKRLKAPECLVVRCGSGVVRHNNQNHKTKPINMKNLPVIILTVILFASCNKNLWNIYRPAQANIVGKKVKSYDRKSNKISLGEINSDGELKTEDEPSTMEESELIDKKLTIDIQAFLKEKAKVVDVKTTNSTVTHISKESLKNLRPGKFVFSAIKAEKAVIELKKDDMTTITPKDLEEYLKKVNPTISEVAGLIKKIESTNNSTVKYEITNPNVYVLFQQAELQENVGVADKWFKNFNTYEGATFTLSPEKTVTETIISPVISKKYRDKVASIKVQLVYEKLDDMENPVLYARYTSSSGSEMKKIPTLSPGVWNTLKFVLAEYYLSETQYKVVYLELDAKQVGKNIEVRKAKVFYPEKSIKIIKN